MKTLSHSRRSTPRPPRGNGRRWRIPSRLVLLVGGFLLAAGAGALAYFTVSVINGGGGYALSIATSLSAPSSPTAIEASSTSVTVSWTDPGTQVTGATYLVTSSPGGLTCTNAGTSCTVSGLTNGTSYTFNVAAKLDNWLSAPVTTSSLKTLGVTTTTLPAATVDSAYTATLAATGGSGTYSSWSQTGTLPAGLSFNTTTGVVSGTPTAAGSATGLTFQVTDSNNVTASSSSLSLVINKAAASVSLSLTSPVTYGTETAANFSVTVTPTIPTGPSGTVNIVGGSPSMTLCTTNPLNGSGQASCTLTATQLNAGTYNNITASYGGDSNFTAGASSAQTLIVNKAAQAISFTSTAPSAAVVGGATYTVTATGGASGNAVTFTIDATASSVCSISGSTVSFTGAGTCVIDANQAGNTNYSAAPQVQQSFAVGKGSQAITVTSTNPSPVTVGGPTYTPTATASSGLPVAITLDGSSSGCTLSGGVVTFTAVGTCKVDFNQAGSANYNAAPLVQQSITVTKGNQTITFTSTAPAGAVVAGPTYTVTATGGASGNPVTFTIDATASSVCTISGSTVSFTGAGTCTIDANQASSANYNAAPQAQQSFAVGKGSQTITFTSTAPTSATVGGATYTVTATGGASGNAVTFTIDATAASVCTISGSTVSFTGVGTCTIDANQASSANYNAAPQAQQSFAVSSGSLVSQAGGATGTNAPVAATFSMTSGVTYLVAGYWESSGSKGAAAGTGTLTTANGTPTFTPVQSNTSDICNVTGVHNCGMAVWIFTANATASSGSVTLTVSGFSGALGYEAVDVLALNGENLITPIVAGSPNPAAGTASPATANLGVAATSGDVSVEIVGLDSSPGSLTWSPSGPATEFFNSNAAATGAFGVFATTDVQNESTAVTADWETIALEVAHS